MYEEGQDIAFVEKLRDAFDTMVVYKDLKKNNFISSFKLPSFMRDWVIGRFQDDDGQVDVEATTAFIKKVIPKKGDWPGLLNRVVSQEASVKCLTKVAIHIDIKSGQISFELPDFGLQHKDTLIPDEVWEECSQALLKNEESWGIVQLGYQPPVGKDNGKVVLEGYQDFCPYGVDLEEYCSAREDFTLDEWIDILLGAVDYNAAGYESKSQKLSVLQRLLPFVEKRINLLELAPAGTGKSYLFGQVSRYGWLVSGRATRAKLIYDISKHRDGIVALRDFVALDEIREAEYMEDTEIQSALQAIMENGKYRAPDNHEVNVDAGIIFLGNITSSAMNEYSDMLQELPKPFHQPQFLDRIHGFIKGWDLPRMTDDLKVCGWALNSEYFAMIMHQLRDESSYRAIVDEWVNLPKGADTRDTEAVKRMCTAYLKLLFPHVQRVGDISDRDFKNYCLKPAMDMRAIMRIQMGYADPQYMGKDIPAFTVKETGF